MTEVPVSFNGTHGLHARPATRLIQEARPYVSKVRLSCRGKEADARSIVGIMALGIKAGDLITVVAEGPDEIAAAQAVAELLAAMA